MRSTPPRRSPGQWPRLSPRPHIELGDFFQSKPLPIAIRCIAYTQPPVPPYTGDQKKEFEPGTFFGPVEAYLHTADFVTELVGGSWINVWKHARSSPEYGDVGIDYAKRIPMR